MESELKTKAKQAAHFDAAAVWLWGPSVCGPQDLYQVWLQMNISAVAQHRPHVLLSNIAGTNMFRAKTAVLKGNQMNHFQSIHQFSSVQH